MVKQTYADWLTERYNYLRRRRCPRCGALYHEHRIAADGTAEAFCIYMRGWVMLPKIKVPKRFLATEPEPLL